MMNSFKARAKKSSVEAEMNIQIIIIFILQIIFCIFASLYYAFHYKFNKHDFDYLDITMDGT